MVKEAIGQGRLYPEMRAASHRTRFTSERSDEGPSCGSDGGEGYYSTHFGESSSNGGEGLHLEREE